MHGNGLLELVWQIPPFRQPAAYFGMRDAKNTFLCMTDIDVLFAHELQDFSELLVPNNATSNTHVPVVPPRDKPDDYGPPELEEEPLPPV